MNDKNLHINNLEEKSRDFFSKGRIDWQKQESEVWKEILKHTVETNKPKSKVIFLSVLNYAAVAVILFLIGLGSAVFWYQKTIECLPGEHLTAFLPDGSEVELNADSYLKYYPLKWRFQRNVNLNGEAFFNVEKGKKFKVMSENGTTEVLGTSFNVYDRDDHYNVTCLTGRVSVTAASSSITLEPGSHVELTDGNLVVEKDINTGDIVSWRNNLLFFAGKPLKQVFEEIERQYGVTINVNGSLLNRPFVGNIDIGKKYNVEEVLNDICKPMQIEFVKQSENVFLIVEKS